MQKTIRITGKDKEILAEYTIDHSGVVGLTSGTMSGAQNSDFIEIARENALKDKVATEEELKDAEFSFVHKININ